MATFWDFTDNSGRLSGNDAEARYDHIGGYDSTVEDSDVVLDNGKIAHDDILANVHMIADSSCLDDGPFADKDVVAEPEWKVCKGTIGERL
jgi:hypothetical protein